MIVSTGQGIIATAVNRLGGLESAAAQFNVRASLLLRFVKGTLSVPDAVLLKAVDLLDGHPH